MHRESEVSRSGPTTDTEPTTIPCGRNSETVPRDVDVGYAMPYDDQMNSEYLTIGSARSSSAMHDTGTTTIPRGHNSQPVPVVRSRLTSRDMDVGYPMPYDTTTVDYLTIGSARSSPTMHDTGATTIPRGHNSEPPPVLPPRWDNASNISTSGEVNVGYAEPCDSNRSSAIMYDNEQYDTGITNSLYEQLRH